MLERLQGELKEAMKARDAERVSVLRMLISELKNERIALGREPDAGEALAVVKRAVKRRDDAAREFDKGGRPEMAEKERREKVMLEGYLPRQLSREETEALVAEAIASTGASGARDLGRVMGAVMAAHKAEVDGNLVREIAASKLGA